MPLYEYRCRACGHHVEELQPMGSGAPGPCPACGGELRRAYGRVGVRLEGWGFSRTDGLIPDDRPRKDFKRLREKAEEITDSG
ncbi:MAG TPA: zinc ribbon domain-containing protein [Actinomycetota bacterium]|nr:zinc ribbon domain-containing protein [Actinomycetota bacterium]